MSERNISLADINIEGGTQMRVAIDQAHVRELAEDVAALPAIDVYFDGATYWLADGFHRYHAHRQSGTKKILCHIHKGTQRDAILHAAAANAHHGLKRSNADKRKAVETLLKDAEWAKFSDRMIAGKCLVSHTFVAEVRAAIAPKPAPSTGNVASEKPAGAVKNAVSAEKAVETRIGKDGREQPATKPATTPLQPVSSGNVASAPAKDREGNAVTAHTAAAFETAEKFDEAIALITRLTAIQNELKGDGVPGTDHLNAGDNHPRITAALKDLRAIFRGNRPHAVCPFCKGEGKDRSGSCLRCKGRGWLAESAFKQVKVK